MHVIIYIISIIGLFCTFYTIENKYNICNYNIMENSNYADTNDVSDKLIFH